MRLAMTMTAYSRPEYLREVLDSLAANKHLDQFTLHFGVEPTHADVLEVCNSVNFMETRIHKNIVRLGVRENPFQLLKRTFEAGYDGVLYLEDDVTLSPDAVELALHYAHSAEAAKNRCLCLYNQHGSVSSDPAVITTGQSISRFSAWVFYLTLSDWQSFFQPVWHRSRKGWDYSVTESKGAHTIALPAIGRTTHIGKHGGVHYRPELYDSIFAHVPYYTGPAPSKYVFQSST